MSRGRRRPNPNGRLRFLPQPKKGQDNAAGQFQGEWEPSEDQQRAYAGLLRWVEDPTALVTLGGYAGTGKALPFDQEVKTPDGPRLVGDLEVGDLVFGVDGKPTRVLGVFPQGKRQAHRVAFCDGASVESDMAHLWAVQSHKMRQKGLPPKTMTLREIVDSGLRFPSGPHKFCVPLCAPVEYEEKDLPVHPYLLGLLIGDRTDLGKTPALSVPDSEKELVGAALELVPAGMQVKENRAPACPQYRFVDPTQRGNRLTSGLRDVGLAGLKSTERFVPALYRQGSVQQRWDVLRGLMDADGSCRNNRTSFSSMSERLARDVVELVQSLGGTAIIAQQNRGDWQVNVKTFECPFRLRRKADRWSPMRKNPPSRFIVDVTPTRVCEHVCIKVEAEDGLFLTEGFIVTHNTTLLGAWAREVTQDFNVAFCTFTGKASTVLAKSLEAAGVRRYRYCGTIHRMMYRPRTDSSGNIIEWIKNPVLDYDFIVVDEASMVPSGIRDDLMAYEIPILAVGDHGQLPPIGEDAGLMRNPDFRLEKVHRQALDNPIVALSVHIRRGRDLRPFIREREDARLVLGEGITDLKALLADWYQTPSDADDTMALCYSNRGRVALNAMIRKQLGLGGAPQPEDRVICVKNAYFDDFLVANGYRGYLAHAQKYGDNHLMGRVVFPNDYVAIENARMNRHQFDRPKTFRDKDSITGGPYHSWGQVGLLFDYGYALTVHKAQGSQARRVLVTVERPDPDPDDDDYIRWLYTAVTRSAEELVLVTA